MGLTDRRQYELHIIRDWTWFLLWIDVHKRKSWLFAGSDRGGQRAAAMYSLMVTARLNDIDPRAWLADVLGRIGDHPASRLDELLPWHWKIIAALAA